MVILHVEELPGGTQFPPTFSRRLMTELNGKKAARPTATEAKVSSSVQTSLSLEDGRDFGKAISESTRDCVNAMAELLRDQIRDDTRDAMWRVEELSKIFVLSHEINEDIRIGWAVLHRTAMFLYWGRYRLPFLPMH